MTWMLAYLVVGLLLAALAVEVGRESGERVPAMVLVVVALLWLPLCVSSILVDKRK